MASTVIRTLDKSENLSILLPTAPAGTKFYFPDDQYIRSVHLLDLIFTPNLSLDGTNPQKDPNGNQLIDSNYASLIYLTLEAYNGNQFVRNRPLLNFLPYQMGATAGQGFGVNIGQKFVGQMVNWPKSYIYVANGAPELSSQRAVMFDVNFKPAGVNGKKEMESLINTGFMSRK